MTMATPDCILSEKILRSSMLANVDDVTGMFTGMEEYTTRAIFAYVTAGGSDRISTLNMSNFLEELCGIPSLYADRYSNVLARRCNEIRLNKKRSESSFISSSDGNYANFEFTYDEFRFCLVLLILDTPHNLTEPWGIERTRLIFYTYNVSENGVLNAAEVTHLTQDIIWTKSKRDPTRSEVDSALEALCLNRRPVDPKAGSLDKFVRSVGTMALRGTSCLFRCMYSLSEIVAGVEKKQLEMTSLSSSTGNKRRSSVWCSGDDDCSHTVGAHFVRTELVADSIGRVMSREPTGDTHFEIYKKAGTLSHANFRTCSQISSSAAVKGSARDLCNSIIDILGSRDSAEDKTQQIQNLLTSSDADRTYQTFINLCKEVRDIVRDEPNIPDMPVPARVFGDIHGQAVDLLTFFNTYGSPQHRTGNIDGFSYVFVGDFVDRGRHNIEVLLILFSIKLRYPDRVCLVRGNHEDPEINSEYGFLSECKERFGSNQGYEVWMAANETFSFLPLGALVGERVLCIHGGVGNLNSIDEIKSVSRPLERPQDNAIAAQVLWSDPTDSCDVLGIHANPRGGDTIMFGPDKVKKFCENSHIDLIVRAHQCVGAGYEFFGGGRLATVFSATDYCGTHNNRGSMANIVLRKSHAGTSHLEVKMMVIEPRPRVNPQSLWS